MILTPDEITELTLKKHRAAQRAVLNALGIQHKVRPDGSLVVSRSHVEKELGADALSKTKKRTQPNWGAMENA